MNLNYYKNDHNEFHSKENRFQMSIIEPQDPLSVKHKCCLDAGMQKNVS